MKRKNPNGSKYPDNWNEIAQAVKDASGWKCVRCGQRHDPEAGYTLTVHHLDIDPSNCAWHNIPALCQRCHLHIQGKVVMEQPYMFPHSKWFVPYVAAYYGVKAGVLSDTKDYYKSLAFITPELVITNADEYIALGMMQS